MTKEELDAITPEGTQFIETLYKAFAQHFTTFDEPEFSKSREMPMGNYLWRVTDIISDIKQNITDIKLAESFLAAFNPGRLPLKKEGNAAEAIRYHYENYFLRATKLRDLCLRLINQVMQFGLPPGNGLERKLLSKLDPAYGQFEVIWGHMKQLNDHVKPYRNHLAHQGTVKHQDLALLNAHYTHGQGYKHKSIVDEFRYEAAMTGLQRELIEKFTTQIKAYLKASDQVLTMIYMYLGVPFVYQMNILSNTEIQ